jgi:hypothetical protein
LNTLHDRLAGARLKSIADTADALDKKMTPVEGELLQVNAKSSEANLNYPVLIDEQLHGLTGSVESDAAPTSQQYAAFESLNQQATPLIAKWKEIRSGDLVALNDMIKKENVPIIYLGVPNEEGRSTKAAGENNIR